MPARTGGARVTPAPHRLVLTAGELAYLVERTGVELPPAWMPSADIGPTESGLIKKRVVDGVGGEVHRSVVKNLEILALPMVMLDTVAAIGDKGLHSMHAISGPLGASLSKDLVASGYNVTHVVTAGSPVPHLDATDNPNTANRTTVTFENQTGTVGENHSIGGFRENPDQPQNPRVDRNYVAVAGQLDQSSDPSVRRFLDSTDAFTQGGPASQMRTYQVTREGVK